MFPISDANPLKRGLPYVNIALIVINVAVFLYELTLSGDGQAVFFFKYGLLPKEITQGVSFTTIGSPLGPGIDTPFPDWLTLFTSMFIHGGILHIAGNMVFLWVFGDNVEGRLGHLWYLIFYLAAGVAAAWTQIAINLDSEVPTIGASGAIAGVLGAYLVLFPFNQVNTVVIFFFITIVRLPAVWLLGAWFLLQAFTGLGSLNESADFGGGVAYWAHIGGFAFGVLAIVALKLLLWRERLMPQRPGATGFWRR